MAEIGVQRRLAAILVADVAGYSRMMGEDEENTLAALTAHRTELIEPCVAGHGGRIVKTTGDGFLVEFSSLVDAVRCAVAFQDGMGKRNAGVPRERRIDFRIGVNLGDVMIQDDDIFGDGVNIAARLEGLAEPGGICVSSSVYDQVRQKLAVRFDDMGRIEVKNVAEPVHVFRIVSDSDTRARPLRRVSRRRWVPAAVAASLAVIVGAGWWWMQVLHPPAAAPAQPVAALSKKASIAVLPFVNLSGDEKQEYFADGMTEDLITDLSKILSLNVISRSSISGYKGKKNDVRRVGQALGVRYVVEGSVRKAGSRVRINAQLVDATTGSHVWGDRYDGDLKDIFGLQDRVLKKIVDALALTLSERERGRLASKGTHSVAAYDLYLRGKFEEAKFTRDGNANAKHLYEQALSVDPNYPLPYAGLSSILQYVTRSGWSDDVNGDLQRAIELAKKAVSLDEQNPYLHWNLSRAVSRIPKPGMLKLGIKSMERAVELDPNFADAYAFLGQLYAGDGRTEEGLRAVETAMRINPHYPFWYLFVRASNYLVKGDYRKATADLESAVQRNPTAQFLRWMLAAAYVWEGRQDDAEWQVEELKSLGFKGNIRTITETQPLQYAPFLERYRVALRKAGIPD